MHVDNSSMAVAKAGESRSLECVRNDQKKGPKVNVVYLSNNKLLI